MPVLKGRRALNLLTDCSAINEVQLQKSNLQLNYSASIAFLLSCK